MIGDTLQVIIDFQTHQDDPQVLGLRPELGDNCGTHVVDQDFGLIGLSLALFYDLVE